MSVTDPSYANSTARQSFSDDSHTFTQTLIQCCQFSCFRGMFDNHIMPKWSIYIMSELFVNLIQRHYASTTMRRVSPMGSSLLVQNSAECSIVATQYSAVKYQYRTVQCSGSAVQCSAVNTKHVCESTVLFPRWTANMKTNIMFYMCLMYWPNTALLLWCCKQGK